MNFKHANLIHHKLFKIILAAVSIIILEGCERNEIESIGKSAGGLYNTNYRDKVIKNNQSHIIGIPECAKFIEAYNLEGKKHPSVNGQFMIGMDKIKELAKQSNCFTQ